jgi:hypothetical protein
MLYNSTLFSSLSTHHLHLFLPHLFVYIQRVIFHYNKDNLDKSINDNIEMITTLTLSSWPRVGQNKREIIGNKLRQGHIQTHSLCEREVCGNAKGNSKKN